MIYKGSFEDILFVLLGIIWIAYSAFKSRSKKPETKTSTVKEQESSEETFQDFLAGMLGEQKVNKPETPVKEEVKVKEKVYSFDDEVESKNFNEEEFKEEAFSEYYIKRQEIGGKEDTGKKVSFNLKKAFIYREILDNKYI